TLAMCLAAGLCFGGAVAAQPAQPAQPMSKDATNTAQPAQPAQPMSKDARDAAIRNADAQLKLDKAACGALKANAKDICLAEANGKEKIAKANAEAAFEGTPKAREKARVTKADAIYAVAKEKCDDLAGNAKDVCLKEAKAAHVRATADA